MIVTSKISIHTMKSGGNTIHLIDTPGFDDTARSDTETFEEIAFWLTIAHDHDISISGIVYLHRITDLRIQGASLQSLEVFKKMCGVANYHAIVLGTTRWDEILPKQRAKAKARQWELCQKDWFWGDVLQAGGKVVSLENPRAHALEILAHIVNRKQKLTLAFQHQVFREHRQIYQTDAGRVLYEAANEQLEEEESRLEEAKKSLREEIVRCSRQQANQDLAELKAQIETAMEARRRDIVELQEGVDTLQSKWLTKLESGMAQERQELEKLLVTPGMSNAAELSAVSTAGDADTEAGTLRLIQTQRVRRSIPAIVDADVRPSGEVYIARREKQSRKLTALTVLGTALGAGQLLAAVTCTIQ